MLHVCVSPPLSCWSQCLPVRLCLLHLQWSQGGAGGMWMSSLAGTGSSAAADALLSQYGSASADFPPPSFSDRGYSAAAAPPVAMGHHPASQSHGDMPGLVEAPPVIAEARGAGRPASETRHKRARRANNTESSGSGSSFGSSSNSGSGTESTSASTGAEAAASRSTTPDSDGQQQSLDWSVARQLLIESEPRYGYGPRPPHVRRSAQCQVFIERPRARRLPSGSDHWRNSGGEHGTSPSTLRGGNRGTQHSIHNTRYLSASCTGAVADHSSASRTGIFAT
jgi:hypothetical protein